MCFDEKTSWLTFIIGTIANVWLLQRKGINSNILYGAAIIWQAVLMVQFWEALLWRALKNGEQELALRYVRYLYITLMVQPLIFSLAVTGFLTSQKGLGLVVAGVYGLYAVYATSFIRFDLNQVLPTKECPHIRYDWWNIVPGDGLPYLLCVFFLFAWLIEPRYIALWVGGYLALTLMISKMFYPCASGGLWCWFAAFAPIFTRFILK